MWQDVALRYVEHNIFRYVHLPPRSSCRVQSDFFVNYMHYFTQNTQLYKSFIYIQLDLEGIHTPRTGIVSCCTPTWIAAAVETGPDVLLHFWFCAWRTILSSQWMSWEQTLEFACSRLSLLPGILSFDQV